MLNIISCLACETNLLSRLQKDFTKKPLDLDNTWSDWSPWSPCSSTCGIGLKTRTRSCHDNLDCVGHSTETFFCRLGRCEGEVFFLCLSGVYVCCVIWCICVPCYLVYMCAVLSGVYVCRVIWCIRVPCYLVYTCAVLSGVYVCCVIWCICVLCYLGPYSPTILKNILCLCLQDLQI